MRIQKGFLIKSISLKLIIKSISHVMKIYKTKIFLVRQIANAMSMINNMEGVLIIYYYHQRHHHNHDYDVEQTKIESGNLSVYQWKIS